MIGIEQLDIWAKELGFYKVGLCAADDYSQAQAIISMQKPLSERRQLRFYPKDDLPDIKSIAVLLWSYEPADAAQPGKIFVDRYYHASNAAYHAALKLEAQLLREGCFAKANVSYPAKEAAVRAGLGIIGKNSLLITPEYGSRVVIILMATGIAVPDDSTSDASARQAACLNCGRCAKACPAGAIDQEGMSHPERCLRNFMMEGVVVPEELRSRMGMRFIGCDVCQRVCPMQPAFIKRTNMSEYCLNAFATDQPEAFSASVAKLAAEIGRNTARPQRIRAQAAILAGNSKDPAYLPVLQVWAQSPFEAVREHAKWAISEIELADGNT